MPTPTRSRLVQNFFWIQRPYPLQGLASNTIRSALSYPDQGLAVSEIEAKGRMLTGAVDGNHPLILALARAGCFEVRSMQRKGAKNQQRRHPASWNMVRSDPTLGPDVGACPVLVFYWDGCGDRLASALGKNLSISGLLAAKPGSCSIPSTRRLRRRTASW